jgi:hypothetical protein
MDARPEMATCRDAGAGEVVVVSGHICDIPIETLHFTHPLLNYTARGMVL